MHRILSHQRMHLVDLHENVIAVAGSAVGSREPSVRLPVVELVGRGRGAVGRRVPADEAVTGGHYVQGLDCRSCV